MTLNANNLLFIVRLITVIYAILLSLASLLPSGDDTAFGGWDAEISPTLQNLLHVPAYAVFILLLLLTFISAARPTTTKTSILLATACVAFGVLLEWLQAVAIPGRYGSLEDALLNAVGVVLGAVVFAATGKFPVAHSASEPLTSHHLTDT